MFERKFTNPPVTAGANKPERYSVEELRGLAGKEKKETGGIRKKMGEKKNTSSYRKEAIRKEKEMGLSRRKFLVKLGLTALGLFGATQGGKKVVDFFGEDKKNKEDENNEKNETQEDRADEQMENVDLKREDIFEDVPDDTEGLKEYIAEKKEEIDKLFDFDSSKPIRLNQELADKIKNEYWRVRYEKGNLRKDYTDALRRMKPYDAPLEKVFQREDVPAILKNISIAESHFKTEDISRSGAAGPFQIMPETALNYGLKINYKKGIDERKNPVKSGQAAAKCIRDLYIKSKGTYRLGAGDWNIAKAGYNGAFIWPYLSHCNSRRIKPNYNDFLKHFSERATRLREQIKKDPHLTVKINEGDNLWKLQKRFGVSVALLKKYNKKKNERVNSGEIIKIPFASTGDRKRIYANFISGYKENFLYVSKVNALLEMRKQDIV